MKIVLLSVESTKQKWFEEFRSQYQKKIERLAPFEIVHLKSSKSSREDSSSKVKDESQKILEFLKPQDFVIVLDERGKSLKSVELAKELEKIMNRSVSRIVFVVGGAFGFDESVKARGQLTLSLSSLVLNHLVAQAVVLESIYRSFAILKNLPYHNE